MRRQRPSIMMASGMWDRLSTTAGALRNQVGRLAEEALASAEEFSQQVRIRQAASVILYALAGDRGQSIAAQCQHLLQKGPHGLLSGLLRTGAGMSYSSRRRGASARTGWTRQMMRRLRVHMRPWPTGLPQMTPSASA